MLIPSIINDCYDITMPLIHNKNTLNIFCDASTRTIKGGRMSTCYGAVAVVEDSVIDELFRIQTQDTSNGGELRGMRNALTLANKWKYTFPNINIFSDSQYTVFSLRDYIYKWRFYNGSFHNSMKSEIKNQSLIIECYEMFANLTKTNYINILHQKGHVNNDIGSIRRATDTFAGANSVRGRVSYDFIRYISLYNNYVDIKSRTILNINNPQDNNYVDGIKIIPYANLPYV